MRPRLTPVLLLVLLAAAACGDDDEPVTSGGGRPTGGDEVVIRVEQLGGFVTPEMLFARTPSVTVYGDGTVLVPGAHIEIYPGPAYVPLQRGTLSGRDVDDLLALAEELELRGEPVDAGTPPVADAPATRITIDDGDRVTVHEAEALGFHEGVDALTDDQLDARERLERFVDEVSGRATEVADTEHVPDTFVLRAEEADPSAVAGDDGPADEPGPRVTPWPVADVDLSAARTCLEAEGEQAEEVRSVMTDADQLTFFTQDDRTWRVAVRPVLPDEDGCPAG
jgi:hypothetical protein